MEIDAAMQQYLLMGLVASLFFLIVQIVFLLAVRPLVLWYFGISRNIESNEKMLNEMRSLRLEIAEQTKWIKFQVTHGNKSAEVIAKNGEQPFSAER